MSTRRRLLPWVAERPKFNHLEMVTTFTYKPSLVKIDARNFKLSWEQTHKHTHPQTNKQTNKQTNRTDYNTLRRIISLAEVMRL